jgi:RNA polymerase sigma-70 factor (ECF subfamily)
LSPEKPEDEDAADAGRVLAGDLGAFAGIVRRWQGRLINLAWRFCNDRAMAEDMAQEAFVKAYKALPTFRGESAFSTWLTAISLNCYRSWLRDREPTPTSFDVARSSKLEPTALAGLLDRERASIVRQLVLTLPPRYRDAMVLYYFHEMNLAATAAALRLPEGTVKARLSRGRALLGRRYAARFSNVSTRE